LVWDVRLDAVHAARVPGGAWDLGHQLWGADHADDVWPAWREHGDWLFDAADSLLPLPGHLRGDRDDLRDVAAFAGLSRRPRVEGGGLADSCRPGHRGHVPAVPDRGPDRAAAAVYGRGFVADPVLEEPGRDRRVGHSRC